MKTFIAYYRVSTQKQGHSGLGLESQQNIVRQFISSDDTIINEYTDVESGKQNNRKALQTAISECKATGATLLIAKLDRLSRNASFIFTLKDSEVDFICCDIPEANTLTIGIFATMAQHERETISKRTKQALDAKKARGFKLGSPIGWTKESHEKAKATLRFNAENNCNSIKAKKAIKDIIDLANFRNESLTLKTVAERLNDYGLKTTRGEDFTMWNVRYLLKATGQTLPKYHVSV